MNSQQAKEIDFPDLLSQLGYQPMKIMKGGRELWYQSPFRQEEEASFHTSFLGGKWIWKDFGDSGGNVIDFVMQHQDLSFKEALAFIRKQCSNPRAKTIERTGSNRTNKPNLSSFQQQDHKFEEFERDLEFLEAHEIQNPVIFSYLENERKIPREIASKYLKEIKYRSKSKGKIFFAFGMENESGGFEIRSASDRYKFKSALIKRDISIIKSREPNNQSVSVFEGMTDFLSLLAILDTQQLTGDALVMHSLSSFERTLKFLKSRDYERINLFLDNDEMGKKFSIQFKSAFQGHRVVLQNKWYETFKDLSEALQGCSKCQINPLELRL